MRFHKSTHAVYRTEYHIVWIPRYRRKILVRGVKQYLEKMLANMEELDEDIEVIKVNVQIDHVHVIAIIPPRISVVQVVQFLKSRTAKKLKDKFGFIQKAIRGSGIWSRGYCVSTIGYNEKAMLRYVEYQEKEDKGQLELDFEG